MNLRSVRFPRAILTVCSAISVLTVFQACDRSQAAATLATRTRSAVESESRSRARDQLLAIAFDAASALPIEPHVKTRSRLQETVAAGWLELREPERALATFEQIADWRRGAGHADYAHYAAEHGADPERVTEHLGIASRIADEVMLGANAQAWRRDRIRAKIARTYTALGRHAEADRYTAGLADSEVGILAKTHALSLAPADLDARLVAVDAVLAGGNLDQVRSGLETCAVLFDRFYADPDRRDEFERRVTTSYQKLPSFIRIDLLARLADSAVDHDDRERATGYVDAAQTLVDASTWSLEHHLPMRARLAELRHRCGDDTSARAVLDRALETFEAERETIADIYRADALLPLAAAWHALGESRRALALYARVVELGRHNQNSRPRAEDLVATCVSMALRAVTPDPALFEKLHQAYAELRSPW